MTNENTTIAVDSEETYPRLNAIRKRLSGDGPGEDATFDDAVRHLLDERDAGGEEPAEAGEVGA